MIHKPVIKRVVVLPIKCPACGQEIKKDRGVRLGYYYIYLSGQCPACGGSWRVRVDSEDITNITITSLNKGGSNG